MAHRARRLEGEEQDRRGGSVKRLMALIRRIGPRPKGEREEPAPSAKFMELAERQLAESGLAYDYPTVVRRAKNLARTEEWAEGRE